MSAHHNYRLCLSRTHEHLRVHMIANTQKLECCMCIEIRCYREAISREFSLGSRAFSALHALNSIYTRPAVLYGFRVYAPMSHEATRRPQLFAARRASYVYTHTYIYYIYTPIWILLRPAHTHRADDACSRRPTGFLFFSEGYDPQFQPRDVPIIYNRTAKCKHVIFSTYYICISSYIRFLVGHRASCHEMQLHAAPFIAPIAVPTDGNTADTFWKYIVQLC